MGRSLCQLAPGSAADDRSAELQEIGRHKTGGREKRSPGDDAEARFAGEAVECGQVLVEQPPPALALGRHLAIQLAEHGELSRGRRMVALPDAVGEVGEPGIEKSLPS